MSCEHSRLIVLCVCVCIYAKCSSNLLRIYTCTQCNQNVLNPTLSVAVAVCVFFTFYYYSPLFVGLNVKCLEWNAAWTQIHTHTQIFPVARNTNDGCCYCCIYKSPSTRVSLSIIILREKNTTFIKCIRKNCQVHLPPLLSLFIFVWKKDNKERWREK